MKNFDELQIYCDYLRSQNQWELVFHLERNLFPKPFNKAIPESKLLRFYRFWKGENSGYGLGYPFYEGSQDNFGNGKFSYELGDYSIGMGTSVYSIGMGTSHAGKSEGSGSYQYSLGAEGRGEGYSEYGWGCFVSKKRGDGIFYGINNFYYEESE